VVRPSSLAGAAAAFGAGAGVAALAGAGAGVAGLAGAAAGVGAGEDAAGAGVAAAAGAAPTVILAMSEPMLTSSPSGVMISIVPFSSASSSEETLSVSRVTSAVPLLTVSPEATCHAATFAEVTDSPAAGTMTSMTLPLSADVGAAVAGVVAGASVAAGAGVEAAGVAEAAAPSLILATTVPIATSSPSGVMICSVPACSASIS